MTIDELVSQYLGKFVEVAGSTNAKNQCVDLANLFIRDVLGLPIIEWTNAQDFPKKRGNNFDWIEYKPGLLPKKGDLMIFRSLDNVGHISINLEANSESFISLDQNWPTGSPVGKVKHSYKAVMGWLRAKGAPVMTENTNMYKGLDVTNIESVKVAIDTWKDVIDGKFVRNKEMTDLKNRIESLENELKTTQSSLTKAQNKLAEATPTEAWEEQKRLMSEAHQQEILAIKNQQDERINEAVKSRDVIIRANNEQISNLRQELLDTRKDWKSRFTSRKFLLTAPTAIFNMVVAIAILLGFKPDPSALATALASVNGVVALFVVPEAITDHKERLAAALH